MKIVRIYILFLILLVSSCGNSDRRSSSDAISSMDFDYASILSVSEGDGYKEVVVNNPWEPGAILQRYILVPKTEEIPSDIPTGTVVRTPLQRIVIYSSVHAEIIREITGSFGSIAGVCDAPYFNIAEIGDGLKSMKIADCGTSTAPTIEKIIDIEPDAIILSPFKNAGYGALTTIGVPIIECADYMEGTPLGRAEWVKFFGLLYEKEAAADSIFEQAKSSYEQLKLLADTVTYRPKVVTEMVLNGIWYVPGGKTYMANVLKDAGADYPWADTDNVGSIQYDFAQVYDVAHDADFWFVKSFGVDITREYMKDSYSLNSEMDAFNNGGLYYCDTQKSTFYADFPFHPDVILKEMIAIFHPELLPDYKLKYYKQVDR